MSDKSDFLNFISENDPFGLLNQKKRKSPRSNRSVLLTNFEEIVTFFEEHNRAPQNTDKDIREFQLYCRLNQIRSNADWVSELKLYDYHGLLKGKNVLDIPFESIIGNDPLNLLEGDFDSSIFTMDNVKPTERISPEYISRRKFCHYFDKYQPQFEAIHKDLESGRRKLAIYHSENLIPNKFFVLGGIVLFLESVEGNTSTYKYNSGNRDRFDGRTVCIFDNGTMSDMLYRSLDKALQKDGYAITDCRDAITTNDVNEDDKAFGYVYVLRSHHSKLKNIPDIYKIGSTTTTVSERVKNAINEPTYLFAGVDVVETYRCFNMGARDLEFKIHAFFDDVRLNINIPDASGVVYSPREWFNVKLEAIKEAIDLILQGKIDDYVYDPVARKIIVK